MFLAYMLPLQRQNFVEPRACKMSKRTAAMTHGDTLILSSLAESVT